MLKLNECYQVEKREKDVKCWEKKKSVLSVETIVNGLKMN